MIDTPAKLNSYIEELAARKSGKAAHTIFVSLGTCGIAAGTKPVNEQLLAEIKNRKADVEIVEVGCMGLCHSEPSIEVVNNKTGAATVYGHVKIQQVPAIVESCINNNPAAGCEVLNRTWYYPEDGEKASGEKLQARIVLRNSGRINPEVLDHYIAAKGYQALAKAVTQMTPQQVIDCVIESGLRGRGGGGFPTGKKWALLQPRKQNRNMLSATPMKVTRVHSWIVPFLKAIRTLFLKRWPLPAMPLVQIPVLFISGPNILWQSSVLKLPLLRQKKKVFSVRSFLAATSISTFRSSMAPVRLSAAKKQP
jgi:(2Fe-2S) ferredoxin